MDGDSDDAMRAGKVAARDLPASTASPPSSSPSPDSMAADSTAADSWISNSAAARVPNSPISGDSAVGQSLADSGPVAESSSGRIWKRLATLAAIAAVVLAAVMVGPQMSLARWADREQAFRAVVDSAPLLAIAVAAVVYVAVTGASLPGAAPLTLLYGWLFGFWVALPLVSCSSTAGATLAMLASRLLFREAVERRFAGRLDGVRAAMATEGPYYLFTLRLIPAVPFFAVNALMGLAPIRVRTYWWVSQLGMLPGTALYVYAGSSVPSLRRLADEGLAAVFAPGQLTRLTVALALLGLFPWVARVGVKRLSRRRSSRGTPVV